MNAVFFGTSDYCLPVLETLNLNFSLNLVITRPDKPIGRKKVLTPSATKTWAIEHNVSTFTPETLKKDTQSRAELATLMKKIKPDLAIVSDYGLIIPEATFSMPRLGTLNIHFSKLPDLRGPSPVQFTLLRGDKEAWVTIFKLETPPELKIKMDSGPVLWQQPFPIGPDDTTQTLYSKLFQEVSKQLPTIINEFLKANSSKLTAQDHSAATFCRFLTKDDGFIDWDVLQKAMKGQQIKLEKLPKIQQEALHTLPGLPVYQSTSLPVYNLYRALTPWPGMFTLSPSKGGLKRMIVRKCHKAGDKLVLDEIQFEGKSPIKFPEIPVSLHQ